MGRRILIVDDEREMRELLRDHLVRRDYEIALTESYDGAVAWLDTGRCDAVITDVRMRERSGIELCEWLRANRPDVPVVVITGFGSLDTAIGVAARLETAPLDGYPNVPPSGISHSGTARGCGRARSVVCCRVPRGARGTVQSR